MSRDRAKIIFDLQRQVRKLDNELFMYGGHARKCAIRYDNYYRAIDACTCGWTIVLNRMLEERRLCESISTDQD